MNVRQAVFHLGVRAGILTLAILTLWLLGPVLWDSLSPFLIALPVAALLQPLIGFLHQKIKMNRSFSSAILVAAVFLAFGFLMYWFVSFVAAQLLQAASNSQTLISGFIGTLEKAAERILKEANLLPQSVVDWLRASLASGFNWLYEQATLLLGSVLNGTVNVAAAVPYALVYINFLIFGLYFITVRMSGWRKKAMTALPEGWRRKVSLLGRTAGRGLAGYLRVQILFALMVLVLSWACLAAFGFPYALLIALIAALLEFLPLFGNGTLYLPWCVICFLIGDPRRAWVLLLMNLGLTVFRRGLEPRLMSANMGLSPFLSLVSMFAGMRLYGVAGLVGGPILMVVIVQTARSGLFDPMKEEMTAVIRWFQDKWRGGRRPPVPPLDHKEE